MGQVDEEQRKKEKFKHAVCERDKSCKKAATLGLCGACGTACYIVRIALVVEKQGRSCEVFISRFVRKLIGKLAGCGYIICGEGVGREGRIVGMEDSLEDF